MTKFAQKIEPEQIISALQNSLQVVNAKAYQLTQVIEIAQSVMSCEKFKTAALALVGQIADKHHAERVSLGWLKQDYIRLKSISHTDHFEKKMQVVKDLEGLMEEAYEQDAAILYPLVKDNLTVLAHEKYSKEYHCENLLSVPIRTSPKDGEDVIGVITCERQSKPFTELETEQIYLASSLCGARLLELYQKSNWFGARIARKTRRALAKLLGFEHTWAKFFGILGIGLVLFATLYPLPYRVSAPAILKTDKVIFATAPYDGYIDSVFVKPGDVIYRGQTLLRLNQTELKLVEADAKSKKHRPPANWQKCEFTRQDSPRRRQSSRQCVTSFLCPK